MRCTKTVLWISLFVLLQTLVAGDNAYYAADDGGGDDGAGDDTDDRAANYSGDDFIKYWTEYAVLPKKCITLGNKDMIVYSMYEKYYNHCTDKAMGTYMIDVPTFVSAYIDQLDLNGYDKYGDDYAAPDETYVNCYPYTDSNGNVIYVQLGCTDESSQSLSVNAYKDNTCTYPDTNANGFDDTNIDVSDLQVPFQQCESCVHFVDKNEDDADDAYFENRMKNAPLCSTIWEYKQKCGSKCKRLGNKTASAGWNKVDKILVSVLLVFSAGMLAIIMKKRTKMSKKDALLEEAAMSAAGIQQSHVIGMFAIFYFIVFLFGLVGLKTLTWMLLLLVNIVLFGYLMKLTIDSGLNVPLGPDGQPIGAEDSSDDEDDDDEEEEGDYKSPIVPAEESSKLPPLS